MMMPGPGVGPAALLESPWPLLDLAPPPKLALSSHVALGDSLQVLVTEEQIPARDSQPSLSGLLLASLAGRWGAAGGHTGGTRNAQGGGADVC